MINEHSGSGHVRGIRYVGNGFTLIELAISIFIVALLLSSLLVPLTARVEQRQISDTQKRQDEIKEALIGFAIANGYLPCPAVSAASGQEGNRTGGVCAPRSGFLPWEALGVSKADAWGRLFRYSVTPAFTNNTTSPTPAFDLITTPDIAITGVTNANSVPAIVISHGQNGYGGTNEQGFALAPPADGWAVHPDENTNATANSIFVSRTQQTLGAAGIGGEFDDIVTWVPRFVLLNRMVAGGKLP